MTSKVRRKPQFTYRSPMPGDHSLFTTSLACTRTTSTSTSATVTTTSSPTTNRTKSSISDSSEDNHDQTPSKYHFSPSLPLFHPLGPLAMSLPPLDAAFYGLPVIEFPEQDKKPHVLPKKSSPPKTTEDDNDTPVPTVSSIAAVAARETKERPSPRKRRNGGGGSSSKRKRKENEDGDATYPAKRTRAPRGANHQGDEELAPESNEAAVVDSSSDLAESIARRTTRSNVKTKRHGSSSSDTASVTGNPVNGALEADADATPVDPPNPEPKIDAPKGRPDAEEREEGELSEDAGNP